MQALVAWLLVKRRKCWFRSVIWLKGTPTVMVGDIEDPFFEEHLRQGPYVVFDDCAKPKYKNDPRVYFVPGHPVLRDAMPALMKGLGVTLPGKATMKLEQFERGAAHTMLYGSPRRKLQTVLKPIAAAGLAVLGIAAARSLFHRTALANGEGSQDQK